MTNILVTGGAGYIGVHTVLELLNYDYSVYVIDNLERGYFKAIERAEGMSGKKVNFHQVDIKNPLELDSVWQKFPNIDAIVHFAAYKNVGEANQYPGRYYENNIQGTVNLLEVASKYGTNKIVFSSSAATYGQGNGNPIKESDPKHPLNAYGQSKLAMEWLIEDYCNSLNWTAIALRYFNAAGAHPSGKLGEDPKLTGNVIPLIMQTLIGKRDEFVVFGDQFNTPDGTQERDYIHVMDLATAHVKSLEKTFQSSGYKAYNLGTGQSTSVNNLIKLSEQVSNKRLIYRIGEPRMGDPEFLISDPSLANRELGWHAEYSIQQIIQDQWNWVSKNPEGYS